MISEAVKSFSEKPLTNRVGAKGKRPTMMQPSPAQLNCANSTGLFSDTMERKVQKWVVLIEWVGCMFFFFLNGLVNYSLRNGPPVVALGYGLLCFPGHGWQWILGGLWAQLSCKCQVSYLLMLSHQSSIQKRIHTFSTLIPGLLVVIRFIIITTTYPQYSRSFVTVSLCTYICVNK